MQNHIVVKKEGNLMVVTVDKDRYEKRIQRTKTIGSRLFYVCLIVVVLFEISELVFQFRLFQNGEKQMLSLAIYCMFCLWKGKYLQKKATIFWAIVGLIFTVLPIVFQRLS